MKQKVCPEFRVASGLVSDFGIHRNKVRPSFPVFPPYPLFTLRCSAALYDPLKVESDAQVSRCLK